MSAVRLRNALTMPRKPVLSRPRARVGLRALLPGALHAALGDTHRSAGRIAPCPAGWPLCAPSAFQMSCSGELRTPPGPRWAQPQGAACPAFPGLPAAAGPQSRPQEGECPRQPPWTCRSGHIRSSWRLLSLRGAPAPSHPLGPDGQPGLQRPATGQEGQGGRRTWQCFPTSWELATGPAPGAPRMSQPPWSPGQHP